MSSSCLQARRGFFPVKELRFLVEIQRVRSSGGDPGYAGAWGFSEREMKKKKIILKLSTGSGHFPQNVDLVGGLAVVPVKTNFGHQFIPEWDLCVPCSCPPGAGILNLGAQGHFSQINSHPNRPSLCCPCPCPSIPPCLAAQHPQGQRFYQQIFAGLSLAYLPRVFWGLIRGGKADAELGRRIFIPQGIHPLGRL